ncbi:putative Carbon monoxide dehydrogenase large chain [Georgfuchsia toluolica]|uniref:Carbon monoxide dehydrogenase large chain n=1 Tax=Georgfuchsia toluolica TaxID=424218 RepID=A0A916J2R5_9PROT|nr:molybdopterin cofactor-binding domain-containing protein [Georgfuchsia toluolica]CAG4883624.1 putative Carbon monoxide dehydrogenase large chain [Georgfuchsia toluolica]
MEMKFSGQFEVSPPPTEVFNLLSDPQKFAPLLPAFSSLEMKDDNTAQVKVSVGIGKIRGTASTQLTLQKKIAPTHATYVGTGKVMGGAYTMTTSYDLEPMGKGTLVKWLGEVQLVGKILSLAGGGMQGYAERQIEAVITSLQQAMSPEYQKEAAARKAAKSGWVSGLMRRLRKSDAAAPAAESSAGEAAAAAALIAGWTGSGTPDSTDAVTGKLQPFGRNSEFPDAVARQGGDKWVHSSLSRKEDSRLVRGKGLFVDDYKVGGMLHMALVRSPYGHARIVRIDTSKAEALHGVVCTLTGKEVADVCTPFMQIGPGNAQNIKDYPMAVEKAIYQGEPVVAVIAENPRIAADAAQLVEVEYEALPTVVDWKTALEDKSILHPGLGSNHHWHGVYEYGEVDKAFAEAAHVVKIGQMDFHRFASTPLETNAVIGTWSPFGGVDFFCNNSFPAIVIQMIAPALGLSIDQVRCKTQDIGGSFGNKIGNYPYMALSALASRKAGGRPVKWVETRTEHMQAGGHGSERVYLDTEVALDKDGVITALRSRHIDDCGAYPRYEPLGCVIWSQVLPACYKLRNIRIDFNQVVTNKGPSAPNRGYSRLQQLWFMERVIDICAHELKIPADEMRLKNYIRDFPYTTPNGCVYDSGNYPLMLEKAKALIGWDEWKKKQAEARADGRWVGIGIGTTLDSGTNNFGQARIVNSYLPFSGNSEVATIKLDLDGTVVVMLGSTPSGQSHETTTAQVVADELGIRPDMVEVRTGFDTIFNSHGGHSGSYASQFAVTGLSAVHGACQKLKKEMKKLASFALEAAEDDLEFGVGQQGPELRVKGTDRSINYWGLSAMVNINTAGQPDSLADVTLNIRHVYRPPFNIPDVEKKYGNLTLTYASQLHIAVVEIDRTTCVPKILAYAAVDDCGNVINPKVVAGQVHGATAHGIGAAMMESYIYDKEANLLTSSFTEYTPITVMNMPDLAFDDIETPSPFSYNGAKGMGEGGGAPLHTISAAVQDALFDQGVIVRNSFNSPNSIYELVKRADRSTCVKVERHPG